MARKREQNDAKNVSDLSPQERHRKFVKENGEWNEKVEQSLSKLRKAVRGRRTAGA